MHRRKFTKAISIAGLTLTSGIPKLRAESIKKKILPSRLKKGDTIGIIAPASIVTEGKIKLATTNLESLGFIVKEGKHIREQYGYLAGSDKARLKDLHDMFKDETVNGIWCIRGGYGCTRLIDDIDYALIKKNPKALIGYSDITALLNAIYQKTGLIGFHGPVGSSEINDYNMQSFQALLVEGYDLFRYEPFLSEDEKYDKIQTLKGGDEEGRIIGGNLSLIAAMVGTKHEIKFKDRIAFIEDVGEEPYRIDRMLTQLINGSDLGSAKAILLGQFSGCNPDNPETSLSLMECLKDRLLPLGIPTIYGLNFGHISHNFFIPVGAKVKVSTNPIQVMLRERVAI